MRIHIATQVIQNIRQTRTMTASDRIAIRWIKANLLTDAKTYDIIFRLQVLEGAFNKPDGSWWPSERRGLREAEKAIEGTDTSPKWVSEGNTGMFALLYRLASNTVKKYRLNVDVDDLMQNIVMGLGVNLDTTKKAAYEVGRINSARIKSGKETPQSIAAGVLSTFIDRKIVNMARNMKQITDSPEEGSTYKNRNPMQIDNEKTPDIAEIRDEHDEALAALNRIIFIDIHNPIGKKIREFMRQSWEGTKQEKLMDTWLDAIESGHPLKKTELAKKINTDPGTVQQAWNKVWAIFTKKLRNSHTMTRLLDGYLLSKGITFDFPDIMDDVPFSVRRAADLTIQQNS